MAVQIKKAELTAQINEVWKIEKLAQHYELPVLTMRKVLKEAGLVIRSFKKPKFELIDDTVEETPVIPNQLDLFKTVQHSEDTSTIVGEVVIKPITKIPTAKELLTGVNSHDSLEDFTNETPEEIEIAEIEAIEAELLTPSIDVSEAYVVDESLENTNLSESELAEDDLLAEMEAILASDGTTPSTEPSVMEEEDDFWDQPL